MHRLPTLLRPRTAALVLAGIVAAGAVIGCGGFGAVPGDGLDLVDPDATPETQALFYNLDRIRADHLLFGHQDDLAYGVTWRREEGRSDVRDVTGSYPAVYGWDVGDLEHGDDDNLDGVDFGDMARWMKAAYRRGGVNTVSWHMDNPVSDGSSWDTTAAVAAILPGGPQHARYLTWLDRFADFAGSLRVGPLARFGVGDRVPLLFRPFHEHTGSWFWWGGRNTTAEDYRTLWRFTVDYLRDERGLDNLLYVYSPDIFRDEAHYLEYYPGDAYVDVLGLDDYHDVSAPERLPDLTRRLRTLVELAEARGKIPVFSETGYEGIPQADWWTNALLPAIRSDSVASRIAYMLVWRNATEASQPGHHYAPYPGHLSADDFVRFYADPFVLFEDGLPDLYSF